MPDWDPSSLIAKSRSILFICTGNTCRSPLAEGICKSLLAKRLQCTPEELPARGWQVRSAGVAAWPGDCASPSVVEIFRELGVDLSQHRSTPVNPELLSQATDVIAMTSGHAMVLMSRYPGIGPTPRLLGGPEGDLDDPIGGDLAQYRQCAERIQRYLECYMAEWLG